jgi:beta-lactamase regulating signal transducer with metallopeptidase domain
MTTADTALVQALGWALIHFAWQGALAAATLGVLQVAARGRSPRLRYAMAAWTLAAMAVMPPVTAVATLDGDDQGASAVPGPRTAPPLRLSAVPAVPAPADHAGAAVRERITAALPAIVLVWCAGVLLFSVRYLGGWRLVRGMVRAAQPLGDAEMARRLAILSRRLRVSRPVRVLESALVDVPTVVGWLRPAILMPMATLAGLSPAQLEAVLAHELAHVRRHDYLANLLQGAVETLLFYHPAVWWVSHRMRVERELCCDDEAVAACGNPVEYARALAGLEALRPAPGLAPAATGGHLFERIARLVSVPNGHGARTSRGAAALVALATMAVATTGGLSWRAAASQTREEKDAPTRPAAASPAMAPSNPGQDRSRQVRPAGAAATAAPASTDQTPEPDPTRPVPVDRLIELASAGVTPEYVDELAALGYPDVTWDQLISMRTQGVSSEFVEGLRDAGYGGLTVDQLVSLRSQGATPDFVRGLAAEGLKDLSLSDLLELRAQGVDPEYVRGLRKAGYSGLSVIDLLGARSAGVDPEDAVALRGMGYTDLSLGRVVGLRSQGVDAEYVRALQAEGYRGLSVPLLIGLRSQGVDPEYIRDLKGLGYSSLPAGELIALRQQGVTPEFVREMKEAGYDRLTTRELIDLRSHGVDPALLKRLKARGEGRK